MPLRTALDWRLVKVFVSNFDTPAFFGFFKAGPNVFRNFGMGQPAQLAFQCFQGGRRQLRQRGANYLRAFRLWKGFQFMFQDARRHVFNVAD